MSKISLVYNAADFPEVAAVFSFDRHPGPLHTRVWTMLITGRIRVARAQIVTVSAGSTIKRALRSFGKYRFYRQKLHVYLYWARVEGGAFSVKWAGAGGIGVSVCVCVSGGGGWGGGLGGSNIGPIRCNKSGLGKESGYGPGGWNLITSTTVVASCTITTSIGLIYKLFFNANLTSTAYFISSFSVFRS